MRRVDLAAGLGEQHLLHLIPHDRLTAWTSALLSPLDESERRTLRAWLPRGSVAAAARELGCPSATVRERLRRIATALDTDLDEACVRVRLLLALRMTAATGPSLAPEGPVERVNPATDCLVWLVDIPTARHWAVDLVHPLDAAQRQTLILWLERHGNVRQTAEQLGVHRGTVARRIARAARALEMDLNDPVSRAHLYLALLTAEVTEPGAVPPPGAPGYGDWRTWTRAIAR
ncbi:helix-turn-helix domain-containing protein [Streptomyces sp. 3N207]|uniref:helix-turn-helix domain-containing protein n=1 Tax=Streptomyces sp. 3N207 TaxID=3457417 RepID=UPI003FD15756